MCKYRFSIFTATFNRASMLEKLAEMINNQTFQGKFEWVIVNDGSLDNTFDIVNAIIAKSRVPIKFINKENGGKHTAWREATKVFDGKYVVTCDDDDPLSPQMLEIFDRYWQQLEKSDYYDSYWEVRSRVQYENGVLVGKELPTPYFDSDYNIVTFKMRNACEMVGCRKVEVLRNEAAVPDDFLFEKECSNFPEGIRWTRAARKYKTRFIPEVTQTYIIGHDSLCVTPKGVKRTSKKNYNSLVSALYSLNEQGDLMRKYNFAQYLRNILILAYSSVRLKKNTLPFIERLYDKFLVAFAYVPAFFIYI